MSLGALLISSYIIAFSGAMMPGPLLTGAISQTAEKGFVAGPLLIVGHGILEIVLIALLLSGLAPVFQSKPFTITVSLAGGVILLYMAAGMIRSLPSLTLDLTESRDSGGNSVVSGIILSISNPYWIIWWATIGLGYIAMSRELGMAGITTFFTGHILGDLTWYAFISFLITGGKRFFSDRIYRILIGTCAVMLIIFSIIFIYSGTSSLIG